MMTADPLSWCVDWQHLKPWEKMLMWFPLIGTQRSIYLDLLRQLRTRGPEDRTAWAECPRDVAALADRVSEVLTEILGWPETSVFLPDDPADIVFWDRTGDLAGVEAIMAVEEELCVKMDDEFWENLSTMTYAEVLEKLNLKRAQLRHSEAGICSAE